MKVNTYLKTAVEEFFFSDVLFIIALNLSLLPHFIPTEVHATVKLFVDGFINISRKVSVLLTVLNLILVTENLWLNNNIFSIPR